MVRLLWCIIFGLAGCIATLESHSVRAAEHTVITSPNSDRYKSNHDGPTIKRGRGDRRYRDTGRWKRDSKYRREQRTLRRERQQRRYREWIQSSTVNCFHRSSTIFEIPRAKTVVAVHSGPWPTLTFTDTYTGAVRTLKLPAYSISCEYRHHNPAFARSSSGLVQGGFQQRGGSTQLFGEQLITCYRSGRQVAQERVRNVSLLWDDPLLRITYTRNKRRPGSVVIDTESTGCIFERAY